MSHSFPNLRESPWCREAAPISEIVPHLLAPPLCRTYSLNAQDQESGLSTESRTASSNPCDIMRTPHF